MATEPANVILKPSRPAPPLPAKPKDSTPVANPDSRLAASGNLSAVEDPSKIHSQGSSQAEFSCSGTSVQSASDDCAESSISALPSISQQPKELDDRELRVEPCRSAKESAGTEEGGVFEMVEEPLDLSRMYVPRTTLDDAPIQDFSRQKAEQIDEFNLSEIEQLKMELRPKINPTADWDVRYDGKTRKEIYVNKGTEIRILPRLYKPTEDGEDFFPDGDLTHILLAGQKADEKRSELSNNPKTVPPEKAPLSEPSAPVKRIPMMAVPQKAHFDPDPDDEVSLSSKSSSASLSGYLEEKSQTGETVYVNRSTHEKWLSKVDVASGQTYYYKESSNESVWELPEAKQDHGSRMASIDSGSSSEIPPIRSATGSGHQQHNSWSSAQTGKSSIGSQNSLPHAATSPGRLSKMETKKQNSDGAILKEELFHGQFIEKQDTFSKTKVFENGKKVKRSWSSCYVLTTGPCLYFYKDQKSALSKKKPEVVIEMSDVEVSLNVDEEKTKKKKVPTATLR